MFNFINKHLPRINYSLNGEKYRYAYGVEVHPRGIEIFRVGMGC